jgi:hypothetical protein
MELKSGADLLKDRVFCDRAIGFDFKPISPSSTDGYVIPNGDHTPSYNQIHLGASHAFEFPSTGPLTARFDIVNVAYKVSQIRSGTGVGVFCPAVRTAMRILRGTGVEVLTC